MKKDDKEISRIPIHAVRQVVVCGNVQVSTQALQTLIENEVPVAYVTSHGKFIGNFTPAPAKNVGLREAQYRAFDDSAKCLVLAKSVVRAKLNNQRALLMRSLRADDSRGSDEPAARDLYNMLRGLDSAASLESILGMEGQGAALYFAEFGRFLKPQTAGRSFDFTKRNRRPPPRPRERPAQLRLRHAHEGLLLGSLHRRLRPVQGLLPPGPPRQTIAGSRPHGGIPPGNRRQRGPHAASTTTCWSRSDFITWRGACQLTDSGRRAFFSAYEQRKATEISHPIYGYKMSYSRMLEVQARMLAAFVRGESPGYTGFTVR